MILIEIYCWINNKSMSVKTAIIVIALCSLMTAKLYQVVSLFRHGARYHVNDLYDGNSTREVWGELTAVGMRQHQTLGKTLRREYIELQPFLSPKYKKEEIEVYSTDFNRTIQSVTSQLYGLYPLGTGARMPYTARQYHIPPYSNKTDDVEQNYGLPSAHQTIPVAINAGIILLKCPNYDREVQKNIDMQLLVYQEMNMTYYHFLKRMANSFKIPLEAMNFSKVSALYDTLTVDQYLGRPVPKDFTSDDYLNLRHLHQWFNFFKISFNLSRAINTYKFNKIIKQFDSLVLSPTTKPLRWTFLSAHDTDMSAALLDLNFSSSQCIEELYRKGSTSALNCQPNQEYASSLIFELHSDNQKDFYVKIRHNGKYVYLCSKKDLTCVYSQWKGQIKKTLVNVDQVCSSKAERVNEQGRAQQQGQADIMLNDE